MNGPNVVVFMSRPYPIVIPTQRADSIRVGRNPDPKGAAMYGRVCSGRPPWRSRSGPGRRGRGDEDRPAGPFGKVNQFQQPFGDGNEYYRRTIAIHSGDKVQWTMNGFHSVTFVPKGEEPPRSAPVPAAPSADAPGRRGEPFWFNSQPNLTFNPLAAMPQGGRSSSPAS